MNGCNIFTKDKIDVNKLAELVAKAFSVKTEAILAVEENNDWLKRKNESIVIEYNGILPKDDDEYPNYHYYELWYDNGVENTKANKLRELLGNDVIIDTE